MPEEKNTNKKKKKKKPFNALKITLTTIKWLLISGIVATFLFVGIAFGYISTLLKDEPLRSSQDIVDAMKSKHITSYVMFNDDTPVGKFGSDAVNPTALNDIPKMLITALISTEDNTFYQNYGVSFKGTLRAVIQQVLRQYSTGGSTITQQLVKYVFLKDDHSYKYKAKNIFLALRVNRILSKDQILLAYLNKVPFGFGNTGDYIYGIKAAAKGIFDVNDLKQLNLAQSAYLVGLPQSPSRYSAFTTKGAFNSTGFKNAKNRQERVLQLMLDNKKITKEQYDQAIAFDLKASLAKRKPSAYDKYPYLMIETEQKASELLLLKEQPNLQKNTDEYNSELLKIKEKLKTGGYTVYTTIDQKVYDMMHKIGSNNANFSPTDKVKGDEQIGAVMIQSKTGKIIGMIEGRDFSKGEFNYATQAYRSPGSTMKPIAAYGPAIQEGKIQPASVINDSPILLKDGQKKFSIPENWDYKYHGLLTARTALNKSYNIPAIKVFLNDVGIQNAWDNYAKRMGITSLVKQDYYSQTGAIGGLTKGINVADMTSAYSTFSNKGIHSDTYFISKIVDDKGRILYQHQSKSSEVFSEQTAYLLTDMMRTVVSEGTAYSLTHTTWPLGKKELAKYKYEKKVPIVGKTGSTEGNSDVWFEGYTPDITLGVWAGYNLQTHHLSSHHTVKKCPPAGCGDHRALNIWAMIMNGAVETQPSLFPTTTFEKPDHIVKMTVSSVSGLLPSELDVQNKKLNTDIFNQEYIPTQTDDVLVKMNVIRYNKDNYIPQPTTPLDMVQEKLLVKEDTPFSVLKPQLEDAIKQLPKKDQKPIDHYRPQNEDYVAPTEVDPRVDDGTIPDAPSNVLLNKVKNNYEITFTPSPNPDVVGYRIYRSVNEGPFYKLQGKVVFTGDDNKFTDTPASTQVYGYYITAVDVAGNESSPSTVIFSDGSSTDLLGLLGPPQTANVNAPSKPTNVQIKKNGVGIVISWSLNADTEHVDHYTLYYSETNNGIYQKKGTSTSSSLPYYSVIYDGFYKVTAVNANGESIASDPVEYKSN